MKNVWLQKRKIKKITFAMTLELPGSSIDVRVFDVAIMRKKNTLKFLTTDNRISNWAYGGGTGAITLYVKNSKGGVLEAWALPAARAFYAVHVAGAVSHIEITSPLLNTLKSCYIEDK